MNLNEPIIRLESIRKDYYHKGGLLRKSRANNVLKGISFEIFKGETVALVGESGSGKSTTARLILGLEQPTKGNIYFKGQELTKKTFKNEKQIRKNIQIVFQDPMGSVNSRMNIWKIISEPLFNFGYSNKQAIEHVKELLNLVGIDESALTKYPHQFSGGQLQRIGIARSIALNPEFLILDEPTSALDVSVQARILKLLKDLQRQLDLTYLFITHDLNVVESLADRVFVMKKGEIVERGNLEDIFNNPRSDYTKLLLESNFLEKANR